MLEKPINKLIIRLSAFATVKFCKEICIFCKAIQRSCLVSKNNAKFAIKVLQFQFFFLFSCIFNLPVTRKRSNRYNEHALWSGRPPVFHMKMGKSRKCFSQRLNLPACSPNCPFHAGRQAGIREAVNTNFIVIGLNQLWIKPESTAPEADTFITGPWEILWPAARF